MIRIAIIDDHAIVRAGLRQFFSEQVDLTASPRVERREAVDIVRKGQVDVLVRHLDARQSGVDALAAIRRAPPTCRC